MSRKLSKSKLVNKVHNIHKFGLISHKVPNTKGNFRVVATLAVNLSMIFATYACCKLGFVKL